MILVTDAHVSEENANVDSFFEMLATIEKTAHDVVFLGDIFDLWLGLGRYEEPIHRRFLAWCRRQKLCRSIGFVEGNHEFFVVRRHHRAFTWSDRAGHRHAATQTLFVHGDLINRADKNYLRFRRLSKNLLTREIVRFLPWGKRLIARLKNKLKTTNQAFRMQLPTAALDAYAESCFGRGLRRVLVGHFHQAYDVVDDQGRGLHVLPAWLDGEQITLVDPPPAALRSGPWRTLCRRDGDESDAAVGKDPDPPRRSPAEGVAKSDE